MANVSIEITGIPKFNKALKQVSIDLEKDVHRAEIKEARANVRPRVRSQAPSRTGKLRSKIKIVDRDDFVAVFVDTVYADAVHWGRRRFGSRRGMHGIRPNPWVDRIAKSRESGFKSDAKKVMNTFEKKATRKLNR